ncbi:MAG: TatD family hydrolase [Patescibacteria group bacterium]
MVFDSHTHIHFPAFDKDRDEVIKKAQVAGVKMITVGTNLETSKEAIEIAEKYPDDIWATVGFHPSHVSKEGWYFDKNEMKKPVREEFHIDSFRKLAEHSKVVAIGECGLDYFRIKNQDLRIKEDQKKVFIEQINLARELQKPLMIHCRPSKGADDAYEDLPLLIKDFNLPKVIHFYVGSIHTTKKLLEFGCSFTFGGVITFVRDYDEVIKFLPMENILLETDAPYVAPEPHRGQRNEPAYVIEVAKKIAELKNVSVEEVINKTTQNTKRIFRI